MVNQKVNQFMKNYLCLILLFLFVKTNAQLVSDHTELQNAISTVNAGETIIVKNGVWNDIVIDINKTGTIVNPITIRAQNAGQVFLEGKPQISLGGAYIIFEGFVFQNPLNLVSSSERIEPIIEFRDTSNNQCDNCTIINIKIDSFNGVTSQLEDTFKWIIVYGQYNEISHSSFVGKYGIGSIINDNRNDAYANYTKIHHNYFAERSPVGELNALNDQDAIRIGNSSTSLSDSYTEVYDNLFYDWSGEVEIISNKSGKNKYYNNTFRDYSGTLTLRHGNDCEVFNNYFFANNNLMSGGVRVIGEDHKIYNNYFEGVNSIKPNGSRTNTTGGINITNGRPNTEINGYYQVKNATIVNNTFVDCDYGLRVGTTVKSDLTLAPENVIIGNNIMMNSSISALDEITAPIGSSIYEGNISQNGSWDLTNGSNNNQTVLSGLLVSGTELYRIPSTSPAVDSGFGTYGFLINDIFGSIRPASFDAGAEEYGGIGESIPYNVSDVNSKIGFLSTADPYISLSTNTIELSKVASSINFDVSSNISWIISNNVDWLSINPSVGSGDGTISLVATENTSGVNRSATVTVSEDGGNITSTLTVNQSNGVFNPENPVSITDLLVSGFGTQEPNSPENTIDLDIATRWSADSKDGSAYVTYDLQCSKIVTSVKIYFHKGSIRTSAFKIGTSVDGVIYSDATDLLTSSGTTVGFEEFTLEDNSPIQYVRIYGYGNSEGSGWNSYEEVEIHGNNICSSLSIDNTNLKVNSIEMYPIPTNNGFITLKSKHLKIELIKIFDLSGKLLYSKFIGLNRTKLDVSFLAKGVYILKADNYINRFVVN